VLGGIWEIICSRTILRRGPRVTPQVAASVARRNRAGRLSSSGTGECGSSVARSRSDSYQWAATRVLAGDEAESFFFGAIGSRPNSKQSCSPRDFSLPWDISMMP
jgi:hypothetical protein